MAESTHEFEARILWESDKSYLIEMTIPVEGHYKFFVPKSQVINVEDNMAGDRNWMFEVKDWWWKKIHLKDFWADEDR